MRIKVTKKTDEERLLELEQKIEQAKAKKQQIEKRVKEKERKERTRELIQAGAIFKKILGYQSLEEAEQMAWIVKKAISENRDKVKTIDLEKSREQDGLVYRSGQES